MTTISDLCDDLLCQIFDRMPVKQVLAIQTVNSDFHRSARTWLKTVDKLTLQSSCFCLRKTFGRRQPPAATTKYTREHIQKSQETLFQSLEKMLGVCTGVETFQISRSLPITSNQLVKLVGSCDNIKQFVISSNELRFEDEDWNQLVQLIKDCDISMEVSSSTPTNQLELLFKTAKKVKQVYFKSPSVDILKTIAYLDQSARVEVSGYSFVLKPVDDQARDIISERVDRLSIASDDFLFMSMRRFERLSDLVIRSFTGFSLDENWGKIRFDQLKKLTFTDYSNGHLISNFFGSVKRLAQLEQLWLHCQINDGDIFAEMLAKTPNINKLTVNWLLFSPNEIPAFEKLFQFLAKQTTTKKLQNVTIDMSVVELLEDEFCRVIDSVNGFASQRTKTKLMIKIYYHTEQSAFEEKTKTMPENVKIMWFAIRRG